MFKKIQSLLGPDAENLLNHQCKGFTKDDLHLPGPDFLDRVWVASDRPIGVLRSLAALFHHGRLATILWCYLRNPAFKTPDQDFHSAADLTGQANYLGVTIEADLIKQKQPTLNGGYTALKFGHTNPRVYSELAGGHPIDMTRYQVANCFMGRAGLINSGGASGANDLAEAVRTAVINKRAGGTGLISGRKAFQRPMKVGKSNMVYLGKLEKH